MKYHTQTVKDTAQILKTDIKNGLTDKEARKRLAKHGKNEIDDKKKKSIISRFVKQFDDFMIIILLCAAAISFVSSLIAGSADMTEPVIILAIVVFNASLGVFQEIRAEHSLEALKKLSSPTATVIRNGKEI